MYTHRVLALRTGEVQIGNAHGGVNGWTKLDNVYGIITAVEGTPVGGAREKVKLKPSSGAAAITAPLATDPFGGFQQVADTDRGFLDALPPEVVEQLRAIAGKVAHLQLSALLGVRTDRDAEASRRYVAVGIRTSGDLEVAHAQFRSVVNWWKEFAPRSGGVIVLYPAA